MSSGEKEQETSGREKRSLDPTNVAFISQRLNSLPLSEPRLGRLRPLCAAGNIRTQRGEMLDVELRSRQSFWNGFLDAGVAFAVARNMPRPHRKLGVP